MGAMLTFGQMLAVHARLLGDRGARPRARHDLPAVERARLPARPTRCSASASPRATASPCSPTTASSGWRSTPRPRRRGWSRCRSTSGSSAPEVALHRRGLPRPRRSSSRTSCWRSSRRSARTCRSRRATHPLRQRRLPGRVPRLRGPARRRGRRRARPAGDARRPVDADVHLRHHRQAEGRDPQPRGGRPAVPGHRDRARPAPRRRRAARHADVPRQLAQLLRRVRLLRRAPDVYSRKSFDPEHACGRSPRAGRPSPRWCRPTTS